MAALYASSDMAIDLRRPPNMLRPVLLLACVNCDLLSSLTPDDLVALGEAEAEELLFFLDVEVALLAIRV